MIKEMLLYLRLSIEEVTTNFETSCAAGAPLRMKKSILARNTMAEKDDQQYTRKTCI